MFLFRPHRLSHAVPAAGGAHPADWLRFARAWAAAPQRVAAVAPSGPRLARLMTRDFAPACGPVLELGPGTGVFTRALLARGIAEADLTLVEVQPNFAALLRARFPRARVVEGDAAALSPDALYPCRRAGAAISGLGLLSMPHTTVQAILIGAFACLRPDGAFYQFTYGPACPVPQAILQELGLQARRIGGTWANLPPAAVYRIERAPHLRDAKERPT
jgi:phosphatidylethanolamine/phosphatidyl-N-methylethanolamine N-methyltransferase